MGNKNVIICGRCESSFTTDEFQWDESGTGYSTKLTRCPECGNLIVVDVIEDYGLDVNNDLRFYNY